jgi:hypothetical protein
VAAPATSTPPILQVPVQPQLPVRVNRQGLLVHDQRKIRKQLKLQEQIQHIWMMGKQQQLR